MVRVWILVQSSTGAMVMFEQVMLLIGHRLHRSRNDLRISLRIDPCGWRDDGSIAIG